MAYPRQPRRPSTTKGQYSFAQVPSVNIRRSVFNRSCNYKTTFDAGYLIPVFLDEALPGDTMALSMQSFGRIATPIKPLMDNMFVDYFFFFVPNRLLWDNWEKMNGQQDNPGDSTDFMVPVVNAPAGGFGEGSLFDYFGVPTKVENLAPTALFSRAYNLIYNEWFRDENLVNSVPVDKGDGPDTDTDYVLLRRGKRHDYFTSCLPWPQKGPSIELPLGQTAPVSISGEGNKPQWTAGDSANRIVEVDASGGALEFKVGQRPSVDSDLEWGAAVGLTGIADLSSATAATILQIREAFQIQKIYERDARGGTRYTEMIRAHFNVVSPDQRLQRPEYLGGARTALNVMPVAATSANLPPFDPQGSLAAFGVFTNSGRGFVKSFTEHGVIIGLMSARADLNYQQGLQRQFSRRTRFEFYLPALAHLGEQGVLNKEIFAQGNATDDVVFGYQERFAEYRYKPSQVTGQFRSNHSTPLDIWHLAQDFSSLPMLNEEFIEEDPPVDRVIAVPSEPHFIVDIAFNYRSVRPMPVYGVPGNIDRF